MGLSAPDQKAAGSSPRRLFFYNAGFLRQPRLRRILSLAGHELRLGLPGPADGVVVWGRSPYAARGEAIAAKHHVPVTRIEDAFLRSIRPGRMGDAPLGLLIDPHGVHFDPSHPSALEQILTTHRLDDSNLLLRARDGIARIQASHLSKYNIHDPTLPAPPAGYVLVIDQTQGDASIRHSGAKASTFREMLVFAQEENPGARVIIKTHPETAQGLRPGHFGPEHATGNVTLLTDPISPWALLSGAVAVYTVSSQLGFEAILTGHRPRVFGQPFYAGWGLSADENPVPRRERKLTRAQLFAAAMILAPTWYDPCRDRLCSFEEAVDQLESEARTYREDRHGHIALGMRMWKRGRLQAVFGREKPLQFQDDAAKAVAMAHATGRGLLIWAGKEPEALSAPTPIRRVEDGFLRSRGLGADLIAPLSLVTDDLGIYYDPSRPSRLEHLIAAPLPPGGALRVTRLIESLTAAGLSKYNLGGALPDLPQGHRIL
ncbi:MAG: capsular polysaccharide biosynthesis protein, partial [Paracoccaceae bacterium]